MRKAAAWNVTGIDRSTQAVAEEAARRAGIGSGTGLTKSFPSRRRVRASGRKTSPTTMRLESVEGRLERLTSRDRAAARRSRSTVARAGNFRRDADEEDENPTESRVETALAKIEARAALSEQRTAKALESVAGWIERDENQRAAESARLAETRAKERAELEAARGQAAAHVQGADSRARAARRDLRWSRRRKRRYRSTSRGTRETDGSGSAGRPLSPAPSKP